MTFAANSADFGADKEHLLKEYSFLYTDGISMSCGFLLNRKECTIQLEIACTKETKEELFTTDESVPKTRRTLNNFFNLAIISEPIDSWQIVRLDAYNSAPIFNFFSGNFSKVNLDIKNL